MGKNNKQKNQSTVIPVKEKKEIVSAKNEVSTPINKKFSWMLGLFIAIVSIAIYSNTFSHRFVLDDHGIIKNNKITKAPISFANTKTIFSTPLRKGDYSDLENSLYRPFTKLLFNIEWNVFGGNAHSFHKINVLLYALLCLTMFLVLFHAMNKKWVIPFFTTLLFAVHPVHTEVVANVKSADEILSLLGIFLALRCMQLFFDKKNMAYFFAAIISFLMGLYSKESTVVAVAIFPLFFYYFSKIELKKNIIYSSVFLACAVLFLISRYMTLKGLYQGETSAMDNMLVLCKDAPSRFASAVYVLSHYIKLFLIPYPLSCDYSFATFEPITLSSPLFLMSFLMFAALGVFVILKTKQKNLIALGIAWFFISISLVSNIFMMIGTTFSDRLLFTPSFGLSLALVVLLVHYLQKDKEEKSVMQQFQTSPLLWGILFGVCVLFSIKTYSRNKDWRTDFNLFVQDIEKYPNATHLLFYMGNHLSGDERKEVLNEELSAIGFNAQQIADSQAKESSKSIQYLTKSLSIFPALPSDGYNQLGKSYFNIGYLDSASKYYTLAKNLDSTNGIFWNNIGSVYYQKAIQTREVALMTDAMNYFKKANKLDSTEADFTNNIGSVYGMVGIYDSAIYWFKQSVILDSMNVRAFEHLKLTYVNIKDEANANYYNQRIEYAKLKRKQELMGK